MSAQSLHFKKGSTIFEENDAADCLYLVKSGKVSIRKRKKDGHIVLAEVRQNEVVGELSLFDHQPRSASAFCLTEVEAIRIDFESLKKLFDQIPPYLQTIMSCVVERLRKADDLIQTLERQVIRDGDETLIDLDNEDPLDSAGALAALEDDPQDDD